MMSAEIKFSTYSARIVNLLHLDPSIELAATDSFLAPIERIQVQAELNIDSAYRARPEVQGLELQLAATEEAKK